MPTLMVAFDEAGNTGANLIDSDQPCFALASVHFTDDETAKILSTAATGQASEIHFAGLKKTNSGRKKVLDILNSPLLTPEKAKVFLVYKPYLITTKIVDMLIENLLHRDGIDLFENGGNIALSNVLFYCIPAFCGENAFQKIQQTFIEMVRTKENAGIMNFYSAVFEARKKCNSPQLLPELETITRTREILRDSMSGWRHTDLDPALPCFMNLSGAWSDQFGEAFSILHDESKAIDFDKDLFESLMNPNAEDIRVGRDRRTTPLFIKSTGITFADSKVVKQIQVADVLAGATAYLGCGSAGLPVETDFQRNMDAVIQKLIIGSIWPTPEVTPKGLGTDVQFLGETEERVGMEIMKRVYFDSNGRPKRRSK